MISPVVNLDNARDRSVAGRGARRDGDSAAGFRAIHDAHRTVRPTVCIQRDSWPLNVRRARLSQPDIPLTFLKIVSSHNEVFYWNHKQETVFVQFEKKWISSLIVACYGPKNNAVGKNNVQLASTVVPSYLPNPSPPASRLPGSLRRSAFIHRLWEKLTPVFKIILLTNSHDRRTGTAASSITS